MKKFLTYTAIILALGYVFFTLNKNFVEEEKSVVVQEDVAPTTIVNIYLVEYTKSNKPIIVPVKRKVYKDSLYKNTLKALLAGPTENELQKGFVTEIPKKTKLINVEPYSDMLIVNLSGDFEAGGGSESVTTRLSQLAQTLSDMTDTPVYLYLNGKEVSVLGGDGIPVKQPINVAK
jgi:spore germination protein GerM